MVESSFVQFLDKCFDEAGNRRLSKDVFGWFDLLCVISLNLSTEMTKDDFDKCNKFKSDFLSLDKSVLNVDEDSVVIPVNYDNLLCSWEVLLRKIRKDAGLQQTIIREKDKYS